jgi:AcrR family transcriptional regulator
LARPRTTIPNKPDDARAQRSIEALRQAILRLVEEKPLDQISIKEITETAGLSYPTFFRRFAGKDELIEDIARGEVVALMSLGHRAMAQGRPGDAATMMCRYVASKRKLWAILLNGGASAEMRREFGRLSIEISNDIGRINPELPFDLSVPFTTSGIFEIFAWWMRQPEDYPVENVLKVFNALIIDTIARRRDIGLI